MIGAVAFLHSAGYFVTFMTGNTERAVLGWFDVAERQKVSGAGPQAALWLMACFLAGVFVASFLRRRYWQNHPHGATALVTFGLLVASVVELYEDGWYNEDVNFTGILIICFSVGALNTSFVKNGEVAVPLSYVTGTVVKLGQGLERLGAGIQLDRPRLQGGRPRQQDADGDAIRYDHVRLEVVAAVSLKMEHPGPIGPATDPLRGVRCDEADLPLIAEFKAAIGFDQQAAVKQSGDKDARRQRECRHEEASDMGYVSQGSG